MRLFFQTIPKPLRQHPILKKIIHSAILKDIEEKLSDSSTIFLLNQYLPSKCFVELHVWFGVECLKGYTIP